MAAIENNSFAHIEEEILKLFEKINSELPPQSSEVRLFVHKNNDGRTVSLVPRNPTAASAWCQAWNGVARVHFGFGDYSPAWELPDEGENPRADTEQLLKNVEDMCRAVIQGKCEHQRRLLGITARLNVDGKTFMVTEAPIVRPKPPLEGTRFYSAYY